MIDEATPMVGDSVTPDPSMAPEPTAAESPAATVVPDEPAPFDPTTVRSEQEQDPAKAGAQFPDGVQVPVTRTGVKESRGGLARTGC
jgi:hypothetical protein